MTEQDKAIMHLGQASLYFHRAGLLEEAAAVQALINKLHKTPKKASA